MLVACWSAKGGAGTSVVAAALAAARRPPIPARGRARRPGGRRPRPARRARARRPPASPGGSPRATTCPPTPSAASRSRSAPAPPCCPGAGGGLDARAGRRAGVGPRLGGAPRRRRLRQRPGRRGRRPRPRRPTPRYLVTRPCYLALRRAPRRRWRRRAWCSSRGGGRALHPQRRRAGGLGAPVVAELPLDPQVASAVDAGSAHPAALPPVARAGARAMSPDVLVGPAPRRAGCRGVGPSDDEPDDAALGCRRGCTSGSSAVGEGRSTTRASAGLDAAARRRLARPPTRWDRAWWPRVRARIGGVGPLEPLLGDPAVTDVLVNGPGPVWVERHGRLAADRGDPRPRRHRPADRAHRGPAGPAGRPHLTDRRRPSARRLAGRTSSCRRSPSTGRCVTIRRFAARRRCRSRPSAPPPVADLLRWAVAARLNVVVSAATGAGKTTLLNALCACTAARRAGRHHRGRRRAAAAAATTSCGSRPGPPRPTAWRRWPCASWSGPPCACGPTASSSARCRGAEALDMIQALNTGHDGSLSSCHANGPAHALRRIETMALTGGRDLPLAGGAGAGRRRPSTSSCTSPGARAAAGGSWRWSRWRRTTAAWAEAGAPARSPPPTPSWGGPPAPVRPAPWPPRATPGRDRGAR